MPELNVRGGVLEPCSTDPTTGFERDGLCSCHEDDFGRHELCAVMTDEFLQYSLAQGNDLLTPQPAYGFPGLKAGDCWCVCVSRWVEALEVVESGEAPTAVVPPVVLDSTNEAVLDTVSLSTLETYAHE